MAEHLTHWIDGRPHAGSGGSTLTVTDPARGVIVGELPDGGEIEVDAAVDAASRAFDTWGTTSLARRQQVMFAARELLVRRRQDLAEAITREHGKTLPDALGEVQRGLEVVDFVCGLPHLLKGDLSQQVSTGVDTFGTRRPLGVCAGITPFNFPTMVPLWMFPVAIACGNTFVLKPSEKAPSAPTLLAEIFAGAGLPDGVLNVVHGGKAAVDRLLVHPDVASVSFVGSTPVARHVYETGTSTGKRVQALGGAKNHMVVLPDADVAFAADQAASAAYGSAGQRCMAISVVVAVGEVADDLVTALAERAEAIVVGPGDHEGSDMGPVVTAEQRVRVLDLIDGGVDAGARLVTDGRATTVSGHEDGYFVGPCLFDEVTEDMRIYTEEIFGPVLTVVRVETLDEAIDLINRNPYANGTALFTSDGGAARHFQRRIEVGMVGVNVPIPVPLAYYSFGGWRASAFGDHGVYGPEGIHFYTRQQTVITRWPRSAAPGMDLGFPQHR